MKRNRNPAEKQHRILEAAEKILNGGGTLAGFSLDKVAQEAGVSKGGLLHHFPSKDKLLQAVSMQQAERFRERFDENLSKESGEKPGRRLRAYISTGLAPNININPLLLSYLHTAEATEVEKSRFAVWHEMLANDGLSQTVISLIRMAVDGVLYTEVIDGEPIDLNIRNQLKAHLFSLTYQEE